MAVMEAMAQKECGPTEVAALMGYKSHAGVSNRVGKGKVLDLDNARHRHFVSKLRKAIGIQPSTVFDRAKQIAAELTPINASAPDPALAELMLNTLENPESKPSDKATARAAILRMLGLKTIGSKINEK